MDLVEIMADITDALVTIDASMVPFKNFQPGVGPYGEPQLLRLIAQHLNNLPKYKGRVITKRTPDLLIPQEWAIEFKIARPFGDNGNQAENWSVNLLHPYSGNTSTIGDCLKLIQFSFLERLAVAVIGYEHSPPKIDLSPLIKAFEVIAAQVAGIMLSERVETHREYLVHPVHQSVRVFAWEVIKPEGVQSNIKGGT
ncbi:hypothetical protein ACFLXK_03905 [Chloroflexota bacterium]